jgi:hypothetical protein
MIRSATFLNSRMLPATGIVRRPPPQASLPAGWSDGCGAYLEKVLNQDRDVVGPFAEHGIAKRMTFNRK